MLGILEAGDVDPIPGMSSAGRDGEHSVVENCMKAWNARCDHWQ